MRHSHIRFRGLTFQKLLFPAHLYIYLKKSPEALEPSTSTTNVALGFLGTGLSPA